MSTTSANTLKLGLIGCGGIVQQIHAPSLLALRDKIQVTAVADPNEENRRKVADLFQVPESARYADHRDLLANADVQAVSIATPHHLHVRQVTDAAEAKVAVISEKPMAATLEDALQIMEAVNKNGIPYAVVHNLLFSLPMRAAHGVLKESFGTPLFGRSQSLFRKADDFATNPNNPGQLWRAQKSSGGGCLIDSCYHEIYSVESLVGSPIRWVEARVKTAYFGIDVDDLALLLCEHENGAVSTILSSWFTAVPDGGRWCEAHGPGGSLRVNHRADDPVRFYSSAEGKWRSVEVPGIHADPALVQPRVTGHLGYFEATADALVAGKTVPVTGAHALHNLAIIEAARKATADRRAVEVAH